MPQTGFRQWRSSRRFQLFALFFSPQFWPRTYYSKLLKCAYPTIRNFQPNTRTPRYASSWRPFRRYLKRRSLSTRSARRAMSRARVGRSSAVLTPFPIRPWQPVHWRMG
jgi:hypothetical protein